jgi:hypothetical protein
MARYRILNAVFVAGTLIGGACSDDRSPIPSAPTATPVAETPREYVLSGEVYNVAGRPLGGSRVEAVSGPRAGVVTTTDDAGRFSMPGLFTGTLSVTVSKDGYLPATRAYNEYTRHVFSLESTSPSANISGTYTLTLTADSAAANLPDHVRFRTYSATILSGSRTGAFKARLNDGRFFQYCIPGLPSGCIQLDAFSIGLVGNDVNIYGTVIEQLAEGTYLLIDAQGQGVFDETGVTVELNGSIVICPDEPLLVDQGTFGCGAGTAVQAHAEHHRLTLSRR